MITMRIFGLITVIALMMGCTGNVSSPPAPESVLAKMTLANDYFMKKWPEVGKTIITNRERPSNIWTRAVYYEGLMALYQIDPKKDYYEYAVDWGEFHQWKFRSRDIHVPETYTRNADDLCAAQTYIDLYNIDPQPERIRHITLALDSMSVTSKKDDWDWIDALQMAMPIFAKMGELSGDEKYFKKMHEMYLATKTEIGGGLYNTEDHLWWRDADFVPPYTEPNGEDCYWSRGNGWVYAALVRVLEALPKDHEYREEYLKTYLEMTDAILRVQRPDGFWNVSLHDPDHFGGKELTGTALFTYGLAWGVNNNVINRAKVEEPIFKAWNAMATECVHDTGFLGYVQGTGKEPKDGQPVTYTSMPDFEDYGLGCFLLAGSEVYKLMAES
jgi:rhamnogalacturonyl hydrolase YesR